MKKFFITLMVSIVLTGLFLAMRHKPSSAATSTPSLNTTSAGSSSPATTTNTATSTGFKDGAYAGSAVDVGYGVVEVQAVIAGGKLTDVKYLSLPSGGHSSMVSNLAAPQLRIEALNAQSANVDIVSGATSTSAGFQMSLQAALKQAS